MKLRWNDLSREEQLTLRELALGLHFTLTTAMADRFIELGLAEENEGRTSLTKKGRDLYVTHVAVLRQTSK